MKHINAFMFQVILCLFFMSAAQVSVAATLNAQDGMLFSGAYKDSDGLIIKRWMVQENGKVTIIDEPQIQAAKNPVAVSQTVVATLKNPNPQTLLYYSNFQEYKLNKHASKNFKKFNANVNAEPLWVADHEWTAADEADYADFISKEASVHYFIGGGVKLDCADTAVAFRWIYARNKHLPIANHLIGSGKLFGHFTQNAEWDRLYRDDDWKFDERFKAALRYVLKNTYTYSIANDLYPVAINQDNIRAGTIHLALHSPNTGHTETIIGIGADVCGGPCIKTIWGNEPAHETVFTSPLNIESSFKKGVDGFLRWVWPVKKNGEWTTIAREAMPGYSMEQYDIESNIAYTVMERLGIPLPIESIVQVKFYAIIQSIYYRIGVVEQGIEHCANRSCIPGSADYDAYSTPSRDGRLRAAIAVWFEKLAQMPDPAQTQANYETVASGYGVIVGGVSYADVIFNHNHVLDNMSNDPNDTLEQRWGVPATPAPEATPVPIPVPSPNRAL